LRCSRFAFPLGWGTGVQYQFDHAGHLTSKTGTGNFTATYVPDLLNRASSKTPTDGTTSHTFDQDPAITGEGSASFQRGPLSGVSFGVVTGKYLYDAAGGRTA